MRKEILIPARALPSRSRDLALYRQNGRGEGRRCRPSIPAAESALGFHPWRALSSAQVLAIVTLVSGADSEFTLKS